MAPGSWGTPVHEEQTFRPRAIRYIRSKQSGPRHTGTLGTNSHGPAWRYWRKSTEPAPAMDPYTPVHYEQTVRPRAHR